MVNTSAEAVKVLQDSRRMSLTAVSIIDDLIAPHDYQDVASLVARAATALLEASMLLMQANDVEAFGALERADDLLDAVYDIIDADTDEASD